MAQAVRTWKKQHLQWTEQQLQQQQIQLQKQHQQHIRQVRQQLEQHYEQQFQTWKKDYLLSLHTTSTTDGDATDVPVATPKSQPPHQHHQQEQQPQCKRQQWTSPDGKHITRYENGTLREISPDGSSVTRFPNGDIQTTGGDVEDTGGIQNDKDCHEEEEYHPPTSPTKLCYFYGKTKILRMEQINGSVMWCFPNGQRELHYPNGKIQVLEWASSTATTTTPADAV
jgi:hypothetical protein